MDVVSQVRSALQSQGLPVPSVAWTTALIASRSPQPPLASLVATAKARLLASDLTSAGLLDVAVVGTFPAGVASAESSRETRLAQDVVVQVLDVENLSRSRWEQVEELEAIERGEQTRGREIIRLPVGTEDDDGSGGRGMTADIPPEQTAPGNKSTAPSANANSTHRVVMQDRRGQKVFGLELKRIPKIGVGTLCMGEKMVLKAGTRISRGVVLLEPANCIFLGGKIDAWQQQWVEGRLQRLREAARAGPERRP